MTRAASRHGESLAPRVARGCAQGASLQPLAMQAPWQAFSPLRCNRHGEPPGSQSLANRFESALEPAFLEIVADGQNTAPRMTDGSV